MRPARRADAGAARLPSRRVIWLGAAGLAGCSVLPQSRYVQQTQWPLTAKPPQTLPRRADGRVLAVRDVTAGPGLDQRGVQWLLPNGSVHVDFYNQWAVPPAQGVSSALRHWLAGSGLFSAVVAAGSGLAPDLVLEGELTGFIADPRAMSAHVALALVLIDQRSTPAKVLMQRTVSAEVRMAMDSPEGIVDALLAALAAVLGSTESDLAAVAGVSARTRR